jgi:flagellar assembly factor FliW
MPLVETKYFGTKPYDQESAFDFPFGLPAFEEEKRFVFIEMPDYDPLVFLQSLSRPSLCFLALPVLVADPNYNLAVSVEDRAALGLDPACQPALGSGTLALALLALRDGFSATVNLMAPILVNVETRRALQAIRMDRAYSHQHPISAHFEHREPTC